MFLEYLNPKSLVNLRKTITFRLILWYSAFFILSTSFLFVLAYFLLSSSVRRKDREETHQKLSEYAAQYQAGGITALKNEVGLEGRSARENPLFVRLVGPQNVTVFLNAPEHWKDFDLTELDGNSRNREQPVYLQTRDRGKGLEIESTVLSDGSVLQVGQSTEEQEALLETFREVFTGFMIPAIILGIGGGSFLERISRRVESRFRVSIQQRPATQCRDRVFLVWQIHRAGQYRQSRRAALPIS